MRAFPGLLFWLATAAPAAAQGLDMTQGGPVQITSRDGIEWRQGEQVVIASGEARAVRAGVTVTADRLLAWYRKKGGTATPPPQPASPSGPLAGGVDTEGNEVYRMRAEGNVHVYTQTDQAWGDQATFELDQSVLVMTGHALRLTTVSDTLTARDTLEYWSLKHMAVARGDAVVVTDDAKRISADTLVAYTVDNQPAPVRPAAGASGGVAAMAGKLQRVEAFDRVTVRTPTDTVTGDRAVYVPDTGMAHLGGNVRITRGLNQLNGAEAVVDMKSGVASLLAGAAGRVTGLVVPNDPANGGLDNAVSKGGTPAQAGKKTP